MRPFLITVAWVLKAARLNKYQQLGGGGEGVVETIHSWESTTQCRWGAQGGGRDCWAFWQMKEQCIEYRARSTQKLDNERSATQVRQVRAGRAFRVRSVLALVQGTRGTWDNKNITTIKPAFGQHVRFKCL